MAAGTPMKAVGLNLPMDTYEIAARMARDSGICVGTKIRQDLVDLYAKADRRRRRVNANGEKCEVVDNGDGTVTETRR